MGFVDVWNRPIWIAAPIVAVMTIASARTWGENAIAGLYQCERGCRVADAAPGIEINQGSAACTNELGGIFYGARLSGRSVACFNKIGTLSEDGGRILWSGGMIWRRLPAPARPSASGRSSGP
jgi:hypothetical protein